MLHFRRFLCALLAALLLPTGAAAAYYETFDHPDVSFAELSYAGIDTGAVDGFCARFAQEPVALYPELLVLYDELYTQNELAYIQMCRNPDDEAASAESGRAAAAFAEASDLIYTALAGALGGPHGAELSALMPEGQAEGFTDYAPLSADDAAAMNAEDELIRQYYLLPDDAGFADAAGELYLKLIALRRAEAERAGFDSYPEYAYYMLYGREYEPSDMRALQRVTKAQLAPLMVRCYASFAEPDFGAPPSDEELLSDIAARIGGVSPELSEAMDALLRGRLYCLGTSDELLEMGYTASLPAYRTAFLFNCADTRFRAYKDAVHEFGHFNAAYHDPTPMLFQLDNIDVAEMQAQGLELLFLPALQDILAKDERERGAVAAAVLGEMLDSVVSGCLYDEFEQAAYAMSEPTVADLHALERKLLIEYGLDGLYDVDEPGWVYINHLFDRPCYYISYAASALPALDLWLLSLRDHDAAVDAYLKVSAARTAAWFFDVLSDNDLCDPTDGRDAARLADALTRQLDAMLVRTEVRAVWYALGGVVLLAAAVAFALRRSRAEETEGDSDAEE